MINDIIEITMNEAKYNARLDFGAIAQAQNNLQKFKKNITVVEMFDQVSNENYLVVNNIIVESIRRCHPQLKDVDILENMKLREKNQIISYVTDLMNASLPKDDKKKVVE